MEKEDLSDEQQQSLEDKLETLLKKQNLALNDLPSLLKSFQDLGLRPQQLRMEIKFAVREGLLLADNLELKPQFTRLVDLANILTYALSSGKL